MSVFYQTTPPPLSPARVYYPTGSRRGSSYGYPASYARPYGEYMASPQYYAPNLNGGMYYQPGQNGYQVQLAQPRYTAPMVYNVVPRSRLYRLYGGQGYENVGCCGCRGGICYGCWDDGRYDTYGHEDDGCCGCCRNSYYDRYYGGRRHHHHHRRDDDCCACC